MQKKPTDISNLPAAKDSSVVPLRPKAKGKVANSTTFSTTLTAIPKSENENCPFRYLIKEWLASGRAAGLSSRTLEDYQEKLFKFWWWWDKFYA